MSVQQVNSERVSIGGVRINPPLWTMTSIPHLLGSSPSATSLADYLAELASRVTATDTLVPQVKSYSDIVYFNYFSIGASLQFSPRNGYKPATGLGRGQLRDVDLQLEAIDIYNVPSANSTQGSNRSAAELAFSTYASLPLEIPLDTTTTTQPTSTSTVTITKDTSGKEFVSWLGEPSRKGGGAGPSTGSIGIWCEWSSRGIMVEFGGSEARGPQAWERGKDAVWRVITIFSPK